MSNDDGTGALSAQDVNLLKDGYTQTALSFVLWGLVLACCIRASYVLMSRGIRRASKATRNYLVSTVVLLTTCVTVVSILYVNFWIIFINDLADGPSKMDAPIPLDLRNLWLTILWVEHFMYLLCESVLVWRAWALWCDTISVKSVLAATYVVTCASVFVDVLLSTLIQLNVHGLSDNLHFRLLMFIPLLATNVIATFFIGLKVWYYRDEVRAFVNNIGTTSVFEKVFPLFVESGFIYAVFWIFYILTDYQVFPNPRSCNSWRVVVTYMAALYPMLTILLVGYERSTQDAIRLGHQLMTRRVESALKSAGSYSDTHGTVSDIYFSSRTSLDRNPPPETGRTLGVMS
ncbi:hypothetical protein CYLTODRAFT_421528 [Cylindrobasidium torrendii FP15055 ss-10]|uniref:Family A G protein-coupled receptor-like protein n=1 Tax=Cylindrobasidium torrendii FP15055 ss-10 TaxID=1314674 RepID=A0A0D7BDC0_9AGAR|nr:hypothetical protein CYLTODRAFT_421528 [Cylindrobasidium torrendii FP15055 ss-10]